MFQSEQQNTKQDSHAPHPPACGLIVFADLLDELIDAEQIIQTLSAQMTDAQRLAACNSLIAVGFPVEGSARCKPRRAAIAAARKAGAV